MLDELAEPFTVIEKGVEPRTFTVVAAGAAARKVGSAPVLLKVAVMIPFEYVPIPSSVPDNGLQDPEPEPAELPEPGFNWMVQTLVRPCVTVTVSPLGKAPLSPAVTVAENTRLVSVPNVAGLPVTVNEEIVAERGTTLIPTGLDVEPAKLSAVPR